MRYRGNQYYCTWHIIVLFFCSFDNPTRISFTPKWSKRGIPPTFLVRQGYSFISRLEQPNAGTPGRRSSKSGQKGVSGGQKGVGAFHDQQTPEVKRNSTVEHAQKNMFTHHYLLLQLLIFKGINPGVLPHVKPV